MGTQPRMLVFLQNMEVRRDDIEWGVVGRPCLSVHVGRKEVGGQGIPQGLQLRAKAEEWPSAS